MGYQLPGYAIDSPGQNDRKHGVEVQEVREASWSLGLQTRQDHPRAALSEHAVRPSLCLAEALVQPARSDGRFGASGMSLVGPELPSRTPGRSLSSVFC